MTRECLKIHRLGQVLINKEKEEKLKEIGKNMDKKRDGYI